MFFVRGSKLTLFFLRAGNYSFLAWWWSEWTWSQCEGSNLTWFHFRDEIGLAVVWVVEFDLLLVCRPKTHCLSDEQEYWLGFCMGGPNSLDFRVGDQTWFGFCVGLNWLNFCVGCLSWLDFSLGDHIWLVFSLGWNWLDFCCVGGWNWIGLWTRLENHSFLVWACKLTCVLCGWSKLTLFQCGRTSMTWFHCRMKMTWLLCGLSKITSFQCGWSALIWVSCSGRKSLVLESGSKLTGVLCQGIDINFKLKRWSEVFHFSDVVEIIFVLLWGSQMTCFLNVDRSGLGFCVGVEDCLVLVFGSKSKWYIWEV